MKDKTVYFIGKLFTDFPKSVMKLLFRIDRPPVTEHHEGEMLTEECREVMVKKTVTLQTWLYLKSFWENHY